MKFYRKAEARRGSKGKDLLVGAEEKNATDFNIEREVDQEDWEMALALIDKNTVERPGINGGSSTAWDHIGTLTTWVSLADPTKLELLRSDPRVKALAKECLRWSSHSLDREATGKVLFPELLREQVKSDPELLDILAPTFLENIRREIRAGIPTSITGPASKEFVHFLQVRPQELQQIQRIFEAQKDIWPWFEKELDFALAKGIWGYAAESAANMILLNPAVQEEMASKIRPYLPKIKAELLAGRKKRKNINTDNWTNGELHILIANQIMSSLAVIFGREPRVGQQGIIETRQQPMFVRPTLPERYVA